MYNQYGLQRRIPDPVKRNIRQRCGFGCVICGNPFIVYHHFDPPFSQAREHRAEGITILCANHASEADKGRRTLEDIRKADANPFCRRTGYTYGILDGSAGPLQFMMGSTVFDTPIVLMCESQELIGFRSPEVEGAPWQLNARILDISGQELLKIERNEWLIGTDRYDITAQGKTVIVRQRPRKIVLALDLVVTRLVRIRRLEMECFGVLLSCTDTSFFIRGKHGGTICFNKPLLGNNVISGEVGIHVIPSEHIVKIATRLQAGSSAGVAMNLPDF